MEENIMECGKMESNMVKDCFIIKKKTHGKKEFGMKAKECDGLAQNKINISTSNIFLNSFCFKFYYL